jgi:hypothetical protein
MQPCNIIYYSNIYWRLNMFRAAHHSSSGALNCICSLWFTYTCGDRSVTTCVCKPEVANTELLMKSGVSLETCWAFNERWNNKFYYKVASFGLFLLSHGRSNAVFLPPLSGLFKLQVFLHTSEGTLLREGRGVHIQEVTHSPSVHSFVSAYVNISSVENVH